MAFNIVFGDPLLDPTLSGNQHAKNQTLTGIDNLNNELVGDVHTITDQARGGNDTLIGGNNTGAGLNFNQLIGDASTMLDSAQGGNNTLIGGNNTGAGFVLNDLIGAASAMSGSAQGGNNTLIGGNNSGSFLVFPTQVVNELFGDARAMSDSTQGGNNTLIGGNNSGGSGSEVDNVLVGAADRMFGSAHAGNNTLIAGTATAGSIVQNDMWGNAGFIDNIFINGSNNIPGSSNVTLGQDTFIFKDTATQTVGTQNSIHDFIQTQHDLIEFAGVAGVTGFGNLTFDTTTTPGSTIIHAGADVVTLVGFTGTLTAHDFVFA